MSSEGDLFRILWYAYKMKQHEAITGDTMQLSTRCSMYQYFIPFFFFFFCQVIFHRMGMLYLGIHSSFDGHLCCFYSLAIINSNVVNIRIQVFVQMYVFISLGIYTCQVHILRNWQEVFQNDCTIVQFHQQCVRVPFLHDCQHLLLSF